VQKKLTIESLVRPHIVVESLADAYRAMGADEDRERQAAEWAEGTCGDIQDDAE
jgi:hypothetical protein